MPVSATLVAEATFTEIIIGIVISLILVAFWQRFLENFLYRTLGLNRHSTFQSLVIAVSFTIIFILVLNTIQSFSRDIVLGIPLEANIDGLSATINNRGNLAPNSAVECEILIKAEKHKKIR